MYIISLFSHSITNYIVRALVRIERERKETIREREREREL